MNTGCIGGGGREWKTKKDFQKVTSRKQYVETAVPPVSRMLTAY